MNTELADEQAIMPKIEDVRSIKPYHDEVYIGPLERGYGHTLGNALRRVMMSSIPGYAATEVKIERVIHEYDRIEGMSEDVLRFLLNLKGVVFKMASGDEATARIKCVGAMTVTAADIETPTGVDIINPQHELATLADGAELEVEIIIGRGVGYQPAANRDSKDGKRYGVLYLDAMFSPVRRVAFQVESARVGSRTDLDRLILNVETNGIYTSQEIIERAARVLVDQLVVFTDIKKDKIVDVDGVARAEMRSGQPQLDFEIDKIGKLSVRSKNCLHKMGIRWVGELVQKTERDMLRTPHLGKKSLVELKVVLDEMGLTLGMALTDWAPPR